MGAPQAAGIGLNVGVLGIPDIRQWQRPTFYPRVLWKEMGLSDGRLRKPTTLSVIFHWDEFNKSDVNVSV